MRDSILNNIDKAFQASNLDFSSLADNAVSSLFSAATGQPLTNDRFQETGTRSAINPTYSSVATNPHQNGKASENPGEQVPLQNDVLSRSTYLKSDHNALDGREFHVASGTEILSPPKEPVVPAEPARPIQDPEQVQPVLEFDSPWSRVIQIAISDLASRENVSVDQIELDVFERGIWSDGSKGCSMPGYAYTMALVDGYRIRLELNDEQFDYHGAYNKREFYNSDQEYVDLPDVYYDPRFCENPTSPLHPTDWLSSGRLGGNSGITSPTIDVELRLPENQAIAGYSNLADEIRSPASIVRREMSTSLFSAG